MNVIIKHVGKSPQTCWFEYGTFLNELGHLGLHDEYEFDPDYHLTVLYNGDFLTSRKQNFAVHADGCLFCGTIYIVSKRKDGIYASLSKAAQEVAYNWLRQRCSWIRG